ncbi:hypothetical protein JTB14_014524 [Gonioctena quinquepunctata]|nr:hypothetical protein JTB14_014524 [Gonioctena quinquepunctata]
MELRFSVLLITLIIIEATNCDLDYQQQTIQLQRDLYRTPERRTYCGTHLAQALSTICKGNYNTLIKKNNYYRRARDTSGSMSDMPSEDPGYPYQKKSEATNLMGGTKRRKRYSRGVYNECCEKSCTREELSTYCAASTRRRR